MLYYMKCITYNLFTKSLVTAPTGHLALLLEIE